MSAPFSLDYQALLQERYTRKGWGASGWSHAGEIVAFARNIGAQTILDYGCGRGTLKKTLDAANVDEFDVREYDPGIIGKDDAPEQVDLVVCTDVLEHFEPEHINDGLWHLHWLALKGLFLVISMSLAKEFLADGRNAHLIVKPAEWWLPKLKDHGITPTRWERRKGLFVWSVR